MRNTIITGVAVGAALALTACGGSSGSGEGNGGDDDAGGEFNIAWNAQPPSMDPMVTTANAARDIGRNVFEQLVTIDASGEVQPVLAEDYEFSEDGTVLTFALREDVPFHNGSTMEATDVVASIERWQGLSGLAQQYFDGAEVESPEEGVVTVTFEESMPQAVALMAEQNQALVVMPEEILDGAPEAGVEEYVGTGPFELGEWASDDYIRLDRFEGYVSPEGEPDGAAGEKSPYFDNLVYHFVADSSTRVAGVQTGEYDAAVEIPFDNVEMLEEDEEISLEVFDAGYTLAILNKAEGNMVDESMRQALLAIADPASILEAAFTNSDYYEIGGGLLPEDSPLFVEVDNELQQGQNLDVAEELLEEAGYDGEEVRLITTRDYEHLYNMSVVLQQQLEDAGVNTDMIVADWPTVANELGTSEGWEIFVDNPTWRALPNSHTHMQANNWGWTDDPDISAALDGIVQADDDEAALESSEQLHEAYYEYLPGVRFGNVSSVIAVRGEYEGFDSTPTSGAIFYNVRPVE